jgi:hypothetical protein
MALSRSGCDGHTRALLRNAKRITIAVDDQGRHASIEFAIATFVRLARRMERERERDDARCAYNGRRTTCDPRATGSAADDERQIAERTRAQVRDDGGPRLIKMRRWCGRAASSHSVRLRHERDRNSTADRGLRDRGEIGCVDTAAGTVPEHEEAPRAVRLGQGYRSRAAWRRYLCHVPIFDRLDQEATRTE